ncbi:MAG: hypothetical protein V3W41_22870 [Planctomycetota bacterium]
MTRIMNIALLLALAIILIGWGAFHLSSQSDNAVGSASSSSSQAAVGNTSSYEAVEVLEVVPFKLGQEMTHYWRKERPTFSTGVLLVLKADPAWLKKRQMAYPVLQYGAETLQILNDGGVSGHAIAILPFTDITDPNALAGLPVFFAAIEIPERITKDQATSLAQEAKGSGASTLGAAQLSKIRKAQVNLADEVALYRVAGDLLERYSPRETDCISWLKGGN